jgi:hypothetical protein
MTRTIALAAALAFAAGCKQESAPVAPAGAPRAAAPPVEAKGRLQELLKTDTAFVGYLYTADKPSIVGGFKGGMLQWRSDPQSHSVVQGRADVFTWPDKRCVGFEQKNLFMPTHGPERYLVCEALEAIKHRNNLPRSQDFTFRRGDLFLEYQPPQGTGYSQIYYLGEER